MIFVFDFFIEPESRILKVLHHIRIQARFQAAECLLRFPKGSILPLDPNESCWWKERIQKIVQMNPTEGGALSTIFQHTEQLIGVLGFGRIKSNEGQNGLQAIQASMQQLGIGATSSQASERSELRR